MVALTNDRRLNRRLPLIVAIVTAAVAAVGIAVVPEWRLTLLVESLDLAALIPAAAPPLGLKARIMLALVAAALAGAAGLGAALIVARQQPEPHADPDAVDVPVLRRADAHPDAPARRPIRASEDLGQPLPIVAETKARAKAGHGPVTEEIAVPADLDTPLAAIDPRAIPDVPREPVRPVVALAARPQLIDPGERFETFELTPIRRSPKPEPQTATIASAPVPAPLAPSEPVRPSATVTSIGSLMERLEKGAARREARPAATIEETLGMLRALATR